jgi:tRNA (guanine37-N1)-methyltransferase
MISGFFEESIVKRAVDKNLVKIDLVNLRDFAVNDYGSVDDRPYGGGTGMIIRVDVIYHALSKLKIKNKKLNIKTIITSPKGRQFNQKKAQEYSKLDHLIIISGHYEGIDERVLDYVDEEISMGDFVMTGGEIAAAAITDAVVRLIPNVLKKAEATQLESFSEKLLEYPQYTRPENFKGKKVPKVLLSGNHKEIDEWRTKMSYKETQKKRKDLIRIDKYS